MLVSGCTINQLPPPTAAPVAAPATAQPLIASTMRAIAAAAVPGGRQRVDFYSQLNEDCSTQGYIDISVLAGPAHGSVEKLQAEEFPHYLAASSRSRCNDRRVPGMIVYYTSNPAFHGVDVFAMRYVTPEGLQITVPVVVTVQ